MAPARFLRHARRALEITLAAGLAVAAVLLFRVTVDPRHIDGTRYHGCYGIGETPYIELRARQIRSLNSDFAAHIYYYGEGKRSDLILINKSLVFARSGILSDTEQDRFIFLYDKTVPEIGVSGDRGEERLAKMECPHPATFEGADRSG